MSQKPERTPNLRDSLKLDLIVKEELGPWATGQYLGVRAKGERGDQAHYGNAIVITDLAAIDEATGEIDAERIERVVHRITGEIAIAGNVTLDMTALFAFRNRNVPKHTS